MPWNGRRGSYLPEIIFVFSYTFPILHLNMFMEITQHRVNLTNRKNSFSLIVCPWKKCCIFPQLIHLFLMYYCNSCRGVSVGCLLCKYIYHRRSIWILKPHTIEQKECEPILTPDVTHFLKPLTHTWCAMSTLFPQIVIVVIEVAWGTKCCWLGVFFSCSVC